MSLAVDQWPDDDVVTPLGAHFPVPVRPPDGFDPARPETWPREPGRFEFLDGVLLYTPPIGETQIDVCLALTRILDAWTQANPAFRFRMADFGMMWGRDVRAADGTIWRRADLGTPGGGFSRNVAPVLAVEVYGQFDTERALLAKARWFLAHGVEVVWLLDPEARSARVLTRDLDATFAEGVALPEHPALPGLAPDVARFFEELPPAK